MPAPDEIRRQVSIATGSLDEVANSITQQLLGSEGIPRFFQEVGEALKTSTHPDKAQSLGLIQEAMAELEAATIKLQNAAMLARNAANSL